jgi:hypothetical protein
VGLSFVIYAACGPKLLCADMAVRYPSVLSVMESGWSGAQDTRVEASGAAITVTLTCCTNVPLANVRVMLVAPIVSLVKKYLQGEGVRRWKESVR